MIQVDLSDPARGGAPAVGEATSCITVDWYSGICSVSGDRRYFGLESFFDVELLEDYLPVVTGMLGQHTETFMVDMRHVEISTAVFWRVVVLNTPSGAILSLSDATESGVSMKQQLQPGRWQAMMDNLNARQVQGTQCIEGSSDTLPWVLLSSRGVAIFELFGESSFKSVGLKPLWLSCREFTALEQRLIDCLAKCAGRFANEKTPHSAASDRRGARFDVSDDDVTGPHTCVVDGRRLVMLEEHHVYDSL